MAVRRLTGSLLCRPLARLFVCLGGTVGFWGTVGVGIDAIARTPVEKRSVWWDGPNGRKMQRTTNQWSRCGQLQRIRTFLLPRVSHEERMQRWIYGPRSGVWC